MGVGWHAGLMRWKPHQDKDGIVYPLNHLHPFRYEVAMPAKDARPATTVQVHVGFGLHCFTKKIESEDCPGDLYRDDRESRTFERRRYRLSKHLPSISRTLSERRCAFAKDENYVTVEVTDIDGSTCRLAVFFNIKRWRQQGPLAVLLVIQSAYALDPDKAEPGRGKIGFNVLLGHALRGTRPRRP